MSSSSWPTGPHRLGAMGSCHVCRFGSIARRARLERMLTRSGRSRRPHAVVAILAATVLFAGCGPTPTASRAPSSTPPQGPSSGASADTNAPSPSVARGTQTDTAWGRIWDNVPAGFPRYPGASVADDTGPEPVSATYAIAGGGDPAQIASWMQAALETATFSTEALSGPLEDGSFVLDSVGNGGCRIQVAIAPMGGLTFVTVRYGAACPEG